MSTRRSALRASIIAALVIAATGCTPSNGPTLSPPSPSTTTASPPPAPSPEPTGPRYDRIHAGFCNHIDWNVIADSLHISVSEARFVDWYDFDPARGADDRLPWSAACGFQVESEDGTFRPDVNIAAKVYKAEEWAQRYFDGWVSTYRDEFGYASTAIEGWWDQGARSVRYDPIGERHWATVIHHIRHHNLYLETSVVGGYEVEGATEEDFFALVDDLALGLVEAVTAYLPCRASPEATPIPVCH